MTRLATILLCAGIAAIAYAAASGPRITPEDRLLLLRTKIQLMRVAEQGHKEAALALMETRHD